MFDILNTEYYQIFVEISIDRFPRNIRLQFSSEFQDLEEKRSKMITELRQAMNSGKSEGAAMKYDLEQ
jgi:hypothetical protein